MYTQRDLDFPSGESDCLVERLSRAGLVSSRKCRACMRELAQLRQIQVCWLIDGAAESGETGRGQLRGGRKLVSDRLHFCLTCMPCSSPVPGFTWVKGTPCGHVKSHLSSLY